jgi:hypothetical protein
MSVSDHEAKFPSDKRMSALALDSVAKLSLRRLAIRDSFR